MILANIQITPEAALSAVSSVALLLIVFLLSRFIKSYDNQIRDLRKMAEKNDTRITALEDSSANKLEEFKEVVRQEISKMQEDKAAYRYEQVKQITNIATTQNLMVETLKEIREEQKRNIKKP